MRQTAVLRPRPSWSGLRRLRGASSPPTNLLGRSLELWRNKAKMFRRLTHWSVGIVSIVRQRNRTRSFVLRLTAARLGISFKASCRSICWHRRRRRKWPIPMFAGARWLAPQCLHWPWVFTLCSPTLANFVPKLQIWKGNLRPRRNWRLNSLRNKMK